MIQSFHHTGLAELHKTGTARGINPNHVRRIAARLLFLNSTTSLDDLRAMPWRLHKLTGDLEGFWSIEVNGPWRIIFQQGDDGWYELDYLQYH